MDRSIFSPLRLLEFGKVWQIFTIQKSLSLENKLNNLNLKLQSLKKLKYFEQLKTLLLKHKTDVCEIVLNKF